MKILNTIAVLLTSPIWIPMAIVIYSWSVAQSILEIYADAVLL